ncbi:MAG: PEP-utilizing enzyme [Nitrospira sp.]
MAALFLPLEQCLDPAVAGGKAVGLARLIVAGFHVPSGICLTTAAYHESCRQAGIDAASTWRLAQELPPDRRIDILAAARARMAILSFPADWTGHLHAALKTLGGEPGLLWAVRSSATNEDTAEASGAGLYKTDLGVAVHDIPRAIRDCWTSLWEERVVSYLNRVGAMDPAPAMAVIVQPMIAARVSGVAFSRHPVTGDDQTLINAVPGLAAPLVSGRVEPDEYAVSRQESGLAATVLSRRVVRKSSVMNLSSTGPVIEELPEAVGRCASLTDREAVMLACAVQEVERALGQPVDVEWAIDQDSVWLLQARPASSRSDEDGLRNSQCEWSRANLKETLPELPSPLGLSFLNQFMENFILRHYRELGCEIPAGLAAVRIVQGRPFINVTLLQSCLAQLGGRPELVTEQMGGEGEMAAQRPARLPAWKLVRALLRMRRQIRHALRGAPQWFDDLKQVSSLQTDGSIEHLPVEEVLRRVEWLGIYLSGGECTFAVVAAVGQAQQVLGTVLPRWLGTEWRSLLNRALQGQHTIISAKQIRALREIADHAGHEAKARAFFLSDHWIPALYREQLEGTACVAELDAFLAEFGHRAIGESDIMSPRFAEDPTYLLNVIRRHLQDASRGTAEQAAREQELDRKVALETIRRRLGWRYDRRLMFKWWYTRLCHASALREANRHSLMYYGTAMRRLALVLGKRLMERGVLSAPDDVFFVTVEEFMQLTRGSSSAYDWNALVRRRRALRRRYAETTVPDFFPASGSRPETSGEPTMDAGRCLHGVSISGGVAEGPVVIVRSAKDIEKVRRGDILVAPVIDPGMVTVLGLAAGLIAEMGGTLSHGAIILREYGIPGVVNVSRVTELLRDGDRVRLNAVVGLVERVPA